MRVGKHCIPQLWSPPSNQVSYFTEVPTVLVVEGDEPLQDIVHDALKDAGFDLLTTASGEEALTLLNSAW